MKNEAREKGIVLLADWTGDIENTNAWSLVFACKSVVSQSLHTCGVVSIFTPLLVHHFSSRINTSTTYTLIRRTLTALDLVHHVNNNTSLGDLIIHKFYELL